MSNVTYFQRYSQKENVATNNTLLLLRYFHERAPHILQLTLNELLGDEDLQLGLRFSQQVRGSDSIPDGCIVQQAISIHLETKVTGSLYRDQLNRHRETIAHKLKEGAQVWLLGLNVSETDHVAEQLIEEIQRNPEMSGGIRFAYTSFKRLHSTLADHCPAFEAEAQTILADYLDYLEVSNLIPKAGSLKVFPVGGTLKLNVAHKLYFEPADWERATAYDYIGLYKNKRVQYIGRRNDHVVAWRDQGTVRTREHVPPETLSHISAAMDDAEKIYPGISSKETRYYLLPDLEATAFRKTSRGGIMGPRVFFLSDVLAGWSDELTVQQIAALLTEVEFA